MTPYLKKSALFPTQIIGHPTADLGILVVIPAYREANLLESLESLYRCDLPKCGVEVIVVINDSEVSPKIAKKENRQMFKKACHWGLEHSTDRLKFHILYHKNLPKKHAGVGLARKIGMDEAVRRLEAVENPKGVLVCFDADSKCDRNYLVAIFEHFHKQPKLKATSIYFEHPLRGDGFDRNIYEAIGAYELHLRYYIQAQRYIGFPFAYQTIGSSMAVRSDAYQQQGGMNRRKAGEDFYFLHKFITIGNFDDLTTTRVIPSPRISKRVPFGTGKAVGEIVKKDEILLTYAPQSFKDLKLFFDLVPTLAEVPLGEINNHMLTLPESVRSFLEVVDFQLNIKEIRKNTANVETFKKRFFKWFNAFMLMKYMHYCRDHFYENKTVVEAGRWLLKEGFGEEGVGRLRVVGLLGRLRARARKEAWA